MKTCLEMATEKAKGRLTDTEILDAFEREGKIREALIASGKTDNLDARVATRISQLALDKKIEAARMKRQIAQNIKARTALDARLSGFMTAGLSPRKALIALWEGSQRSLKDARVSGYAQSQAYEARWLGSVMATIQRERPHIAKLLANRNFDTDVTRELFELRQGGTPGKTGNSDAAFLAKTLAAHMEMSRTELNQLGAAIGKLDGYAGPQIHDDMQMALVDSGKWIDDIRPHLDMARSFPDATSDAEINEILGGIYDTIITGVSNDITPLLKGQRVGPANIATKIGKHRVLHFKDADAALAYRDLYGRGSTIQGIMGMFSHQARMAGAMDTFGPNPKAMLLSIAAKMQKDLKAKVSTMPPGKARDKLRDQIKDLDAVDGEVAKLKSTIDSITGLSTRPVNITAATIGHNIRTWQGMAKLGGAVLTAMPTDTVTMGAAAMFRGQGFWKGTLRSMGEIANRKDGKEIGYLLGEGYDGLSGQMLSYVIDGAPGVMSKAAQTFYKWSGLSGWTDTARAVSARVNAAYLGMNVGKTFDQLDTRLKHVLTLNGITDTKWGAIRRAGYKEVNGNHYLTPDGIRNLPDDVIERVVADKIAEAKAAVKLNKKGVITPDQQAKLDARIAKIIKRGRTDLELDLHRYYADEATYSVIETDAASRRVATAGYRPGTLAGEAMRYIMQFKGFPIAFSQRVLGRAVFNAPTGRGGQAAHIGSLLAGLTVAGYMAITTKDMARGTWPPRDPFSPKTWLAAALQGGALGIYGDFLFGERSRYGQGPIETLSGPTVGVGADLYNIYKDFTAGDPSAGRMLDTAINNTPYINMFYTRQALDILFLNSMREAAKPGYLNRQKANLQKERGQSYVLPRTLGEMVN